MAFKVPAYSQVLDVSSEDWRDRACGIVALKMVMDFWKVQAPAIDELIHAGFDAGAYLPGIGWKHRGLVDLAVSYGCSGEAFDWSERPPEEALRNLKKVLDNGPVIMSIHRDFDPANGGHLIVGTGMEGRTFFYADPAATVRDDVHRSVPVQLLLDGWKQRGLMIMKGDASVSGT